MMQLMEQIKIVCIFSEEYEGHESHNPTMSTTSCEIKITCCCLKTGFVIQTPQTLVLLLSYPLYSVSWLFFLSL